MTSKLLNSFTHTGVGATLDARFYFFTFSRHACLPDKDSCAAYPFDTAEAVWRGGIHPARSS